MHNFFSLFFPHENNNYRAKLLHHNVLLIIISFLFLGSFLFSNIKRNFPSVLGISVDVSSQKLLLLTNKVRGENGLPALTLDNRLSQAASNKADNMFAQNYWAHNSPDGKTPWLFIKNSGYNYVYAGENLARGFNNTEDVLKAWMASPSHRENILSQNYKDIGFTAKIGRLNGEETVLIVEEFGNQTMYQVSRARPEKEEKPTSTFAQGKVFSSNIFSNPLQKTPLINSLFISSNLDRAILIIFISALILDMIIAQKKNVVRAVGHNVDHILFLLFILFLIAVFGRGLTL